MFGSYSIWHIKQRRSVKLSIPTCNLWLDARLTESLICMTKVAQNYICLHTTDDRRDHILHLFSCHYKKSFIILIWFCIVNLICSGSTNCVRYLSRKKRIYPLRINDNNTDVMQQTILDTFIQRTYFFYIKYFILMLLLYSLAAVRKVKYKFAWALLKSGKWTSAHAHGGIPHSAGFVACSNLWKISALAATQFLPINLNKVVSISIYI